MALDDTAHVGQSDAGAFEFFHAMQALEHAEQLADIFHVETYAVVAYMHHMPAVARFGADLDDGGIAPTRVFHGVGQQVAHGQVDVGGIGEDRGQIGRYHPLDLAFLQVGRQFVANLRDRVSQVDPGRPQRRASHLRERQQRIDQVAGKARRVADVPEVARAPFG
ncbi:hypothetical protein PIGHUM_04063 [Pigmentiphaga humi]|uniref:Uncharacterized protein n=1 Tax=Pigmentiphaga humi TaxID=2478468 RepID=A0A3P4B7R2_9BURK|nr:hypothetical protein PIGHUM_04063 [Pigmentiphaga humi]